MRNVSTAPNIVLLLICLSVSTQQQFAIGFSPIASSSRSSRKRTWRCDSPLFGWVQKKGDGEWEWQEDDPNFVEPARSVAATATATIGINEASTGPTPQLPSGQFRPKQSLGQNYLNDPNTVAKIVRTFHKDATRDRKETDQDKPLTSIIELGPGAGAITDRLVANYGTDVLQCIEIDQRAVEILNDRYPALQIIHEDVLQTNYPELAKKEGKPLVVIGNLPYYITSQILFALADASHTGAVDTATVTMQWEVAQRMVAPTSCKDYGILSVVFQTYAEVKCHFKIPNTVFYPKPKVDSALVGLHFLGPDRLRQRLAGVDPADFRNVVTTAFQQRRKTVRNSLKKLSGIDLEQLDLPPLPLPDTVLKAREQGNDIFAQTQELPQNWASKRPEELTPGQFVELTRLLFGSNTEKDWGSKVWRKLKHGT